MGSDHDVLGVKPDSPPEVLRQAFRGLVRRWHPDSFPPEPQLQRIAQEKLREIIEAYERLRTAQPAPEHAAAPSRPRPRAPQAAPAAPAQHPPERPEVS